MEMTDYVLDNYFKAVPERKYLYRSILSKIDELEKGPVAFPKAAPTDTLERGTVPGQNVLIVFSDGKVYDNNRPLDPDYFLYSINSPDEEILWKDCPSFMSI